MEQGNNPEYYVRREREERVLAERARDPAIAAIHRDMADRYAALITGPAMRSRRPLLRIVTSS